MSSLVLLDSEGAIARKLQFVSLPDDYVVPEGMTVSWREDFRASSRDPLASFGCSEPPLAYFYFGKAKGQVCRREFKRYEKDNFGNEHFGSRVLTVTVQGNSAKDVMALRDRILHILNSGADWDVINDWNPKKKGFLRRLIGK